MACLLPLCILTSTAAAIPLQNITLPLPVGTSNHGTPGLLCTPTKWTDVVLFFLLNYVAHAATALTRPGERSDDSVVSFIGCLLLPVIGLYRGIEAIFSGAVFVKNDDLRKAARSGALCMVVRGNDWRPVDGDEVGNAVFRREKMKEKGTTKAATETLAGWDSTSTVAEKTAFHVLTYSPPWMNSKFGCPVYVYRQILHGAYKLPEGYCLAIVPFDAQFAASSMPNAVIEVSATYNVVKALVALIQAGYALLTLYRSRGDQIEQFGYAAFGLTVTPYAVMSIINLLGNLCRPDYPSLYLIESSIMDEARKRGGMFDGSIGRLQEESTTVCGCGFSGGNDVEQLRFSADEEGSVIATFGRTSPPASRSVANSTDLEKITSLRSSLTPHSHSIKPLPEKLNYTGTQDDALLLIPCCNPIQRSATSSSTDDAPTHHQISRVTLRKTNPLCKPRSWSLRFKPSPAARHTRRWQSGKYLITAVIAFTPMAINGALSRFQPGSIALKESSTWRTFVMEWLIWAVITGIFLVFDQETKDASPSAKNQFRPLVRVLVYVINGSCAVGVFVVAGQMLARYGVCVWVGD